MELLTDTLTKASNRSDYASRWHQCIILFCNIRLCSDQRGGYKHMTLSDRLVGCLYCFLRPSPVLLGKDTGRQPRCKDACLHGNSDKEEGEKKEYCQIHLGCCASPAKHTCHDYIEESPLNDNQLGCLVLVSIVACLCHSLIMTTLLCE